MPTQSRNPRWRRIAEEIEVQIHRGDLSAGEQLPTEIRMSEYFSVSRFTIRQALAHLESLGLVQIEHGRGIFVADRPIPFVLDNRTRFSENLRRLGLSGERRFIRSAHDGASDDVAAGLGLSPGDEVVVVHGLAIVDSRPAGIITDYFDADRFAGIDKLLKASASRTAALAAFGVKDYVRLSTKISSRMPSGAEAKLLNIARTRPILESAKVDVDTEARPVAFGRASFCADRVQFVIE